MENEVVLSSAKRSISMNHYPLVNPSDWESFRICSALVPSHLPQQACPPIICKYLTTLECPIMYRWQISLFLDNSRFVTLRFGLMSNWEPVGDVVTVSIFSLKCSALVTSKLQERQYFPADLLSAVRTIKLALAYLMLMSHKPVSVVGLWQAHANFLLACKFAPGMIVNHAHRSGQPVGCLL